MPRQRCWTKSMACSKAAIDTEANAQDNAKDYSICTASTNPKA